MFYFAMDTYTHTHTLIQECIVYYGALTDHSEENIWGIIFLLTVLQPTFSMHFKSKANFKGL